MASVIRHYSEVYVCMHDSVVSYGVIKYNSEYLMSLSYIVASVIRYNSEMQPVIDLMCLVVSLAYLRRRTMTMPWHGAPS